MCKAKDAIQAVCQALTNSYNDGAVDALESILADIKDCDMTTSNQIIGLIHSNIERIRSRKGGNNGTL